VCCGRYLYFLVADGLARVVYEGVLFEAEGDGERLGLAAAEVDSDGGDWDWLLRLWETELHHEPELTLPYLTRADFDSSRDMWY